MSAERWLIEAVAAFKALSPEQQEAMIRAQRESWARSIVEWPKPRYRWENGMKIYESYEDYCND